MKGFSIVLFILGTCFCVAGFLGHTTAWAGAALSFFAAVMILAGRQRNGVKGR